MTPAADILDSRASDLRRFADHLDGLAAAERRAFVYGGVWPDGPVELADAVDAGAAALRAVADSYDRCARLGNALQQRTPTATTEGTA